MLLTRELRSNYLSFYFFSQDEILFLMKCQEKRIGHDDVFIAHLIDADNIREKYQFDSDHKWVDKGIDTK